MFRSLSFSVRRIWYFSFLVSIRSLSWIWSKFLQKKIITSNIKSPCYIFFVNQRIYIFIKGGWISDINCNYLLRNIVREYVFKSFIKNRDFFINRPSQKLFPKKNLWFVFYSIRICILVMPVFPFILWRVVNLKFKFCVNYLVMTIWM